MTEFKVKFLKTAQVLIAVLIMVGAVAPILSIQVKASTVSVGNISYFAPEGVEAGSMDYNTSRKVVIDNSNRAVVIASTLIDDTYVSPIASSINHNHRASTILRYTTAGVLDTNFNSVGYSSYEYASPLDLVVTPDGKYYVAGYTYTVDGENAPDLNYPTVWKYNSNGTLDTTFSGDGIMYVDVTAETEGYWSDIELDASGNIFLMGVFADTHYVVSYSPAGVQLSDISATLNGQLQTKLGTTDYTINDMDISEFGMFFAGSYEAENGRDDVFVVKTNSSGELAPIFSLDGVVKQNVLESLGLFNAQYNEINVLPNGKVIVSGTGSQNNTHFSAFAYKFNPDGTSDTTFGNVANSNGKAVQGGIDIYQGSYISNNDVLVLDDDQGILFLNANNIIKLTADGKFDTTFNSNSSIYASSYFPGFGSSIAQRNEAELVFSSYDYTRGDIHVGSINLSKLQLTAGGWQESLVGVGETDTNTITVKNVDSADVNISLVSETDGDKPAFEINNANSTCAGAELAYLETCTFEVVFTRTSEDQTAYSISYDVYNNGVSLGNIELYKNALFGDSYSPVYRFFNKFTGAHLYTISENERETVQGLTNEWNYEGMVYNVETEEREGLVPVYRFWNSQNGAHLYTISEDEKNQISTTLPNFQFEGIKYYVSPEVEEGKVPVYRFFNTQNGAHVYTISEHEKTTIETTLSDKFNSEGVKYYVMPI